MRDPAEPKLSERDPAHTRWGVSLSVGAHGAQFGPRRSAVSTASRDNTHWSAMALLSCGA